MQMAEVFAQTSEAIRLKVGCLLIKEGNIISHGVNGMPPRWHTEECEDKIYSSHKKLKPNAEFPYVDENNFRYSLVTKPECRHAEIVCLEKMWNSHTTTENSIMIVTHLPCFSCSLKIKTAGVSKVYYKYPYRCGKGLQYLINNGIGVEREIL